MVAALLTLRGGRAAGQQAVPLVDSTVVGRVWALVLQRNPELVALRAGVEASTARVAAAGYAGPAVLSAETDDGSGANLGAGTPRIEVSREFLTGGRSGAARALAQAGVRASAAALRGAERRLLARTGRSLADLLGWSLVARRLAAEDSLLASAEESLRDRFSVGEARYTDVLRLRTERLRTQAERAGALTEARVGRQTLEALAAGPSAQPPGLQAMLDSAVAAGPSLRRADELPAAPDIDSLVALSGEVQLAEAALARTRAERRLTLAEQRPRLAAGAGAQLVGDGDHRTIAPALSASVSLPFTAARANRAASVAADRAILAAEAGRSAATSRVRLELEAARARYDAARERLAVYDAALLRGAREERESALAAYRSGELSLIELLDFERALARAEIDRVRAHIDAADALADLLAAGSETDAPVTENPIFRGSER